jgi:monoterpene epsilon-lactone hydrolase
MITSSARDLAVQMFLDAFGGLVDVGEVTVDQLRQSDDALFNRFTPGDAQITAVDADGVNGLWVDVDGTDPARVLVWLHGGGYMIGSASGRRGITADVGRSAGCRGLVVDYRLAPEHPFPAAVEDAVAVFRWLLERLPPSGIVLAGDSAGGGLAIATMLAAKSAGLPLPAGAVLLSPLVDFAFRGESHQLNRDLDPFVSDVALRRVRHAYLGDRAVDDPLASPLYGDLTGLPPVLILVGSTETLLDDSRAFADRARTASIDVDLRIYEDMFHLWPLFAQVLPEGAQAVNDIGDWVRDHTA